MALYFLKIVLALSSLASFACFFLGILDFYNSSITFLPFSFFHPTRLNCCIFYRFFVEISFIFHHAFVSYQCFPKYLLEKTHCSTSKFFNFSCSFILLLPISSEFTSYAETKTQFRSLKPAYRWSTLHIVERYIVSKNYHNIFRRNLRFQRDQSDCFETVHSHTCLVEL